MTKQFTYSDEHIEFLRTGYMQMSVIKLTKAFNEKFNLNKSADTVKSTLKNRGIKCGRSTGQLKKGQPQIFTLEQKQWFIENYPLLSRKAITVEFNRVFNESRTESQVVGFLKRNKIQSGRAAHFKKGQM